MCIICHQHGAVYGAHPGHVKMEIQAFTLSTPSFAETLAEGYSWSGTAGQPATVGYSFAFSVEGGGLLDASEQLRAESAMQAWSNVANITFQETAAFLADLTFSQYDLGSGLIGLATTYFSGDQILSSEVQLDSSLTDFSAGTLGYLTLLHEIGHAIGMKHPGNYSSGDIGPYLSDAEDTYEASVMSYNAGELATDSNPPVTPMIYDIATIQAIYGANTSYNSGDSVYSLSGIDPVQTIWDGGGTDLIDASSYSGSSTIDLREGLDYVTQVGVGAVWMAFGANIENAFGGSGSNVIYGNSLANALYGYGGNDSISGGAGNDVIFGGTGRTDTTDGNDTIAGGADFDTIFGNAGNDLIYGGTGVTDTTDIVDLIYGGLGVDTIYGNAGDDRLYGGGGSADPSDNGDLMYGGLGADELSGNAGNDTIYGGGGANHPLDQGDIIWAGRGDDLLYGNGGNDSLYGHEGNDSMHGGVGDDVYYFQSGGGDDVILYFEGAGSVGGDLIAVVSNINGSGIASALDVLARISYGSGNALIDLGGGDSVTISGIAENGFSADDFVVA